MATLMEQEGQWSAAHPVAPTVTANTFALAVFLVAHGHRVIRAELVQTTGKIRWVFVGQAQADKDRYFEARGHLFALETQARKAWPAQIPSQALRDQADKAGAR